MRLEGRIWKDGKVWLAEVPALDLVSEGASQKDALEMIADAVESLVDNPELRAFAEAGEPGEFTLGAHSPKLLLALLLRRHREAHKLSLAAVADRLGQTSKNAYGRYEQGTSEPSLEKLQDLLRAVAPHSLLVLSIRPHR